MSGARGGVLGPHEALDRHVAPEKSVRRGLETFMDPAHLLGPVAADHEERRLGLEAPRPPRLELAVALDNALGVGRSGDHRAACQAAEFPQRAALRIEQDNRGLVALDHEFGDRAIGVGGSEIVLGPEPPAGQLAEDVGIGHAALEHKDGGRPATRRQLPRDGQRGVAAVRTIYTRGHQQVQPARRIGLGRRRALRRTCRRHGRCRRQQGVGHGGHVVGAGAKGQAAPGEAALRCGQLDVIHAMPAVTGSRRRCSTPRTDCSRHKDWPDRCTTGRR